MAGRFFLGPRDGSGMSLRIMKNPAHDPSTTARTDYDKFAFDSESGDLAYAYGIDASPSALSYIPMISTMASFESGWWEIPGYWTTTYNWGGNMATSPFGGRIRHNNTAFATPEKVVTVGHLAEYITDVVTTPIATKYLLWQLPATNTSPPFPSSTGGVSRIYKSGSQLRVPRVGIAATNGDPNNFILHESIRPAKVIAAGRITISSGTTITLPGPISSNIFVGGHFSEPGGAVTVPYNNAAFVGRRVQFRILNSGRNVEFRERSGNTVDLSYFVVAEDASGQTSGSAPWLKGDVDDQGVSYVQVRRPGCSAAPSFADILVDSRWQAMPMVASGFVSAGSFGSIGGGGRSATVSIPTLGYKPLVLCNWYIRMIAIGDGTTWLFDDFREGYAAYGTNLGEDLNINQYLGDTSFVEISDGSLTFKHYLENPRGYAFDAVPPEGVKPSYGYFGGTNPAHALSNYLIGVRYYVFAIPQG